jgi:mono/diheme cytochrome c family protein
LSELQSLLGLDPSRQGRTPSGRSPAMEGYDHVTIVLALGHSTALAGRLVSPINPRVIVLTNDAIMTFQRGVQRVEIATPARDGPGYDLYLLELKRSCDAAADGCSDLYSEQIERDWTDVTIRDDEQLKNTALDCRQCHARGRERNGLLMRELEQPWTHFFLPNVQVDPAGLPGVSGIDLTRDFVRAHGDETYANVPTAVMQQCSPPFLQGLAGAQQPLFFDAQTIERERWPAGAKADPQPSPAWEKAYAAFKRGEQLALPYLDARATDPEKQAQLTEAYTRYRNGEIGAEELPDLADIFPDDPELRARIGLEVSPDASAPEALIQACGSCHNDVLDQSLSRARFNIDLSRLDREELDRAIERIELPATDSGAMPPAEFRQLTPEQRERVIAYLRRDPAEADESLKRAAVLGMAGGARQP